MDVAVVAAAALAGMWGWVVLNMPDAPRLFRAAARLLRRLPNGQKLVACGWCLGAWLAITAVAVAHVGSGWYWGVAVEAFAAAGLTGILTTMLPLDDGTPTDDH